MFSLLGPATRLCDQVNRRELLRAGGLGVLGLSLPELLRARETAPQGVPPTDKTFGRAKNVIFLWLQGGPPQHETFDPKPNAPAEIRGPFKPISTNIPGMQFCELLPRTSRIGDKLAVIRSMATDDNNHDSSGYWLLTGYKYQGPNSRTIQPSDWPYFGSIIKKIKPSERLPPLSTVWIPDILRLNESVTPAGQTAGFLGGQWDPDRFIGDPADPRYKVAGLRLTDLPPLELKRRETYLSQVDRHFGTLDRGEGVRIYDSFQRQAFELMTSDQARNAFAIEKEPDKVRDRYGRTQWGQCVLLSRRLIEAGVRLVHVNWCRQPGDSAVGNPMWDTHAANADRVEDVLCPLFDVSFTALIEDLQQRGLLDETLVIAAGEFGRTPKINKDGGRDHWGPVFSLALAGAGIAGGQVYGASDEIGAYPARDRVGPADLTATIFHLLGIDYQTSFHDREGREHRATLGTPLFKLLGVAPATNQRIASTGDLARVPPYDNSLLLNTRFALPVPLHPVDRGPRPQGWRAVPQVSTNELLSGTALAAGEFGVSLIDRSPDAAQGKQAAIGFGLHPAAAGLKIAKGATAILAQEVRDPFAGRYTLTAQICGDGVSQDVFNQTFAKHFTCRLSFYQFTDPAKDPRQSKELASVTFQPSFSNPAGRKYETFELTKVFENPKPGENFSFGLGMGIAVTVEKTSPGELDLPADGGPRALIRIDSLRVDYVARQRNDEVKV